MAAPLPAALSLLSYSRLEAFEKCPRQFWHNYVDKTPPDGFDRIESWMGSLVHRVLEETLKETAARRVPDPLRILQRFDELWKAGIGPHVLITREERDQSEYYERGRSALKDYVDKEWPFLDAVPILIEETVEFPVKLPDGAPTRFAGVVDRVDRLQDGRLRLIDYKTGTYLPAFATDREKYQLALYLRALQERFPDVPGGVLVWHYLQHRLKKHVDPDDALIRGAEDWVGTTAATIRDRLSEGPKARDRFPPKPSPLCRWCEFGYACEANPYRAAAPKPMAAAP